MEIIKFIYTHKNFHSWGDDQTQNWLELWNENTLNYSFCELCTDRQKVPKLKERAEKTHKTKKETKKDKKDLSMCFLSDMMLWLAVYSAQSPVTPGLILFPLQKIIEYLRLETITEVYLVQSSHSSTERNCPDNFWISQKMESPLPLWATCASVPSPSKFKRFPGEENSCVSVCSHCLFFWCYTQPQEEAWLSSLHFISSDSYIHWQDLSWDCSFPVPPPR